MSTLQAAHHVQGAVQGTLKLADFLKILDQLYLHILHTVVLQQ